VGLLPRREAIPRAPALLQQAAVYTVSQLASAAIPFLLLPVMTRYLTPTDYGIVTMFLFLAVILEPIIGLGLNGAITVKFYDKSIDLPRYFGTGLCLVLGVAMAALLLLVLTQNTLSEVTQVPPVWLLLAVPLVLARVMVSGLLALLRVREQPLRFGLFVNLQSLSLLALAVSLVVALSLTWEGRLAAELVSWLAFGTLALVLLTRAGWLRFEINGRYGRDIVSFGVPLIPHAIGAVLMVQTDRLLLTNLVGVGETGLYAVGYQLAVVIQLAAIAFNNAYAPWLFRNLSDADDQVKRRLVKYTYMQIGVMAVLAGGVAIVMPWVGGLVLGRDFAASSRFVGWFALGFFFSSAYYMVTNYIFFAQKTRWLALVTISVALLNIPLTYGFIEWNGAVGAAQAMAISFGLFFLLTWIVSNRVYPMPWLGTRSPRRRGDS
jgi:O-antigen/teichoic acid export membrane protein